MRTKRPVKKGSVMPKKTAHPRVGGVAGPIKKKGAPTLLKAHTYTQRRGRRG